VRLAHLSLHRDYGFGDLVPSRPLSKSHVVKEGAIRIRFDHPGSGLMMAKKKGFMSPELKPEGKFG
jgi:hypothetical protein